MPTPGHVLGASRLRAWPPLPTRRLPPLGEGSSTSLLLLLLAACSPTSGSAPASGQGTSRAAVSTAAASATSSARRPPTPLEAPEVAHFERLPIDAAAKAKSALAAFLDASATDMRAYHSLRRAVSSADPFFRTRRAEAEALFGPEGDPTAGPLGRLDTAVFTSDRQAIDKEAAAVKQALSALAASFEKDRVRLPLVASMLPRAAYSLGAILAGAKPGVALSPRGLLADAQGHLDAIEQMIAFNNQYVSPNPEYGPAVTRAQERIGALRKAFTTAESAGELTGTASLVVQTGHLGAELRALLGPSSDLWVPPPPAVSAAARPSPGGLAEPTSVLTLPRSSWSSQAPIDRFARGDEKALTPEDRLGFDVAAGKGRCFTCHVPPHFGGDAAAPATPSLRNIDRTAPYFHDGALPSLEAVVDFYDKGGDATAAHPRVRKLDLSAAEKKALLRFLRAALAEPAKPPR